MTAHTPWIAHKSPDSHDYAYSLQDDDIAFLLFDFHPDVKDERRREIARLIAAAPDLLAACRYIVEAADTGDEMVAVSLARAAIAKAVSS